MRRAFSAVNGYQYEDAYKDQREAAAFSMPKKKAAASRPHSKTHFGRKAVPLLRKM
jgi:hypothetical protein